MPSFVQEGSIGSEIELAHLELCGDLILNGPKRLKLPERRFVEKRGRR
jgi:hypothetical protein